MSKEQDEKGKEKGPEALLWYLPQTALQFSGAKIADEGEKRRQNKEKNSPEQDDEGLK